MGVEILDDMNFEIKGLQNSKVTKSQISSYEIGSIQKAVDIKYDLRDNVVMERITLLDRKLQVLN